jgi:hypothetical protein
MYILGFPAFQLPAQAEWNFQELRNDPDKQEEFLSTLNRRAKEVLKINEVFLN